MSLAPVSKTLFQKTSANFKAKIVLIWFSHSPAAQDKTQEAIPLKIPGACKRKTLRVYSQSLLVTQGKGSWSMRNTESIFS